MQLKASMKEFLQPAHRWRTRMSLTWCSVEDATYPHTSRSLAVSCRHPVLPQDEGVPGVWEPVLPAVLGVGPLGGVLLDHRAGANTCLHKVRGRQDNTFGISGQSSLVIPVVV